jgi:hypothetical protein
VDAEGFHPGCDRVTRTSLTAFCRKNLFVPTLWERIHQRNPTLVRNLCQRSKVWCPANLTPLQEVWLEANSDFDNGLGRQEEGIISEKPMDPMTLSFEILMAYLAVPQ